METSCNPRLKGHHLGCRAVSLNDTWSYIVKSNPDVAASVLIERGDPVGGQHIHCSRVVVEPLRGAVTMRDVYHSGILSSEPHSAIGVLNHRMKRSQSLHIQPRESTDLDKTIASAVQKK